MKKLIPILAVCLLFISCSEVRVYAYDENLAYTETNDIPFVTYEGKPFTGVVYDTFPNGQIGAETHWKKGEIDGLVQRWFENGQLREQESYLNGERNGLYTRWDINGLLTHKSNWKDGERID